MRLCYIDESGTPQIPGNTSHYILAGLSIPINKWKKYDNQIEKIKSKYELVGSEIHTAWLLRPYHEQTKIPNFESMDTPTRQFEVKKARTIELQRLSKSKSRQYTQTKKNFEKSHNHRHSRWLDYSPVRAF